MMGSSADDSTSEVAADEKTPAGGGPVHYSWGKKATTAATRKWSDVDHEKLLATVAVSTAGCCIVSQPLYLVLARQQCAREHVSMRQMGRVVWQQHGLRGFFRGCPSTVSGMVIFQVLYYIIVELGKEYAPVEAKAGKDFCAGIAADALTNPLYIPFSVVAQRQMTAGSSGVASSVAYENAYATARTLAAQSGHRSLFRGMGISMAMLPLAGLWWAMYEQCKVTAYRLLQEREAAVGPLFSGSTPVGRLPEWLSSTTDNALLNVTIGGVSSAAVSCIANPMYVLRSRVQVMIVPVAVRFPTVWVAQDLVRREGMRALFRGVKTNMFMGTLEGGVFAGTYEGSKYFADITSDIS